MFSPLYNWWKINKVRLAVRPGPPTSSVKCYLKGFTFYMTIMWLNKPTMSILVFFYYHLPKQTITHKIILNSINLFRKIPYDNSSSRFTPNSIYQTSLDGWMLNAKYNKHEEWCFIGFLNTKMLFWKQIRSLGFFKNWFMMDKTKVRGLLKGDVDEFRVIFSLVWFRHVDSSGACQQHKRLSSVFHVSKFVYIFFSVDENLKCDRQRHWSHWAVTMVPFVLFIRDL